VLPVRVEGLKPRVNYRVVDWNADGAGSLEVRHRIATGLALSSAFFTFGTAISPERRGYL
jgi:hypothetical protein